MATYRNKAIELLNSQIEWVRWQILAKQNAIDLRFGRKSQPPKTNLRWTGRMIDWVELLYSLHAAGCINRGQITLKELFQQMGEVFGFEVTEFSNYFMNIKNRKDKNRTKFMDSMRAAILEVMIASDRKPSWK